MGEILDSSVLPTLGIPELCSRILRYDKRLKDSSHKIEQLEGELESAQSTYET
jgi:hypothetical protein